MVSKNFPRGGAIISDAVVQIRLPALGFRRKHAVVQGLAGQLLMTDQRPGRVIQVGKKRITHGLANKGLTRLVDIFADDLEKRMTFTVFPQSDQLFAGIADGI